MVRSRPDVSVATMTRIFDALEEAQDAFELVATAYAEAARYVLYERLYVLDDTYDDAPEGTDGECWATC